MTKSRLPTRFCLYNYNIVIFWWILKSYFRLNGPENRTNELTTLVVPMWYGVSARNIIEPYFFWKSNNCRKLWPLSNNTAPFLDSKNHSYFQENVFWGTHFQKRQHGISVKVSWFSCPQLVVMKLYQRSSLCNSSWKFGSIENCNIWKEIALIQREMLENVMKNTMDGAHYCIPARGGYFSFRKQNQFPGSSLSPKFQYCYH